MSQDIQFIKKILSTCEEIDSIFDLKKGDIVRYITIDDGSEFFYEGGKYLKMLDNKILIKNDEGTKIVPITIMNSQGDILYKTRFFIECGEKCKVHSMVEYDKIIKNQQRIIEALIQKNKQLEKKIKDNLK